MPGNTIPPKLPMQANSAIFAAQASALNAANKTPSNASAALGGKRCAVGPGENRQRAQAAITTIAGLFTSLSNCFKSVLYSAKTLLKPLSAYIFSTKPADDAPAPKKAMKQASAAMDQAAGSAGDFLNANSVLKHSYRQARDVVNPPQSALDSLERQASDALTDIKAVGENLLHETQGFLKKLF